MAVTFIRTVESHTGNTGSTAEASYTFQPGQAGDAPKGIVVFTFCGGSSTDVATAVTYGGSTLNTISGGYAYDATTELGCVTAWLLGSSVPTGAPTGGVVVTRTNNSYVSYAVAFLLAGGKDLVNACEPSLQGVTNAAIAPQPIPAGSATSIVLAGAYSGDNTPAPVGNADMTVAHTLVGSYNYTFGSAYETTPTTGTRTRGCTQATSDDIAHVIIAITEYVALTSFDPFGMSGYWGM